MSSVRDRIAAALAGLMPLTPHDAAWAEMRRSGNVEDRSHQAPVFAPPPYTPMGMALGAHDIDRAFAQDINPDPIYPPVTPLGIDAGSSELDRLTGENSLRLRMRR